MTASWRGGGGAEGLEVFDLKTGKLILSGFPLINTERERQSKGKGKLESK
jgi:hypothetical protein